MFYSFNVLDSLILRIYKDKVFFFLINMNRSDDKRVLTKKNSQTREKFYFV